MIDFVQTLQVLLVTGGLGPNYESPLSSTEVSLSCVLEELATEYQISIITIIKSTKLNAGQGDGHEVVIWSERVTMMLG